MTYESALDHAEDDRQGMVSIIIPSFGRMARLKQCLDSINRSELQQTGWVQVVVVTSTYTESEIAEIECAGAAVVRLNGQVWVSEARNAGAASAIGEYLLFLDDDNVIAPDAIRRLREAFELWPDTAVAGPVMYYASAPETIWCAGVSRSKVFMKTHLASRLPYPLPDRLPSEDFPNCFMVRRRDFEDIGGFDVELFPLHMEESDLARRLVSSRGGNVYCVPTSKVWHFIGTGLASRLHIHDARRAYWMARGRALFTAVYGTRLQWFVFVVVGQWAMAAVYLGAAAAQAPDRARVIASYVRGMLAGVKLGTRARRNGSVYPNGQDVGDHDPPRTGWTRRRVR